LVGAKLPIYRPYRRVSARITLTRLRLGSAEDSKSNIPRGEGVRERGENRTLPEMGERRHSEIKTRRGSSGHEKTNSVEERKPRKTCGLWVMEGGGTIAKTTERRQR